MKTFYFGQALNDAPKEHVEFGKHCVAEVVRQTNLRHLPFIGLGDHGDTEVFDYDYQNAMAADYGIFLGDYGTWGGGIEIVYRQVAGLPNVALFSPHLRSSKMFTGWLKRNHVPMMYYQSATHFGSLVKLWTEGSLPK